MKRRWVFIRTSLTRRLIGERITRPWQAFCGTRTSASDHERYRGQSHVAETRSTKPTKSRRDSCLAGAELRFSHLQRGLDPFDLVPEVHGSVLRVSCEPLEKLKAGLGITQLDRPTRLCLRQHWDVGKCASVGDGVSHFHPMIEALPSLSRGYAAAPNSPGPMGFGIETERGQQADSVLGVGRVVVVDAPV